MIPNLLTLDDLPAKAVGGRPVFVRVDFNLPMEDGHITDRSRLLAALPTIRELQDRGAALVLASHRGRPGGERRPELTLQPVAEALAHELESPVLFVPESIGAETEGAVRSLGRGEVCLLENLRFHGGEEANDPVFCDALSKLASIYVSDAFGTVHRAHASTAGLAERVRYRVAGRLVELEVRQLRRLVESPEHPYVAMLGGAKVSGKIDALSELVEVIDVLLLGGALANTFLAAVGIEMGDSLVEVDRLEVARSILERCRERCVEVLLPEDLVTTPDLAAQPPHSENRLVDRAGGLEENLLAVDLGPRSIESYKSKIEQARTLFWNGPLGVFEKPPFDRASMEIARAVALCPGFTVIGGGETGVVASAASVANAIDHVSTGGGASLAFLAGKSLPGLEAVSR